MPGQPRLEARSEQHYVAIPARVTMEELGGVLPSLNREVFEWLGRRGVPPAGPPFVRYLVIDMADDLEVEAGVPVAAPVAGDDRVRAGAFPTGRYATVVHTGPYDRLAEATAALLAWAEDNGIVWQVRQTSNGDAWAARTEFYLTDPATEPDPEKWQTELAFLVADDRSAN